MVERKGFKMRHCRWLALVIFVACAVPKKYILMPSGLLITTTSFIISTEHIEDLVLFYAKRFNVPSERISHLNIEVVFGFNVDCGEGMVIGCFLPEQNLIRLPTNPKAPTSDNRDPSFEEVLVHELGHWVDKETGHNDHAHLDGLQ